MIDRPLIALLTDFGLQDPYVGVMKGVMKAICPAADFIDITHHIPPQDVRAAAFHLMNTVDDFPRGTVFLIVVDPGVGTQRQPIAVQTDDYAFISPDNGVLSYTLANRTVQTAVTLENWWDYGGVKPRRLSHTFHGRDIFAPAAAWTANGGQLTDLIANGAIALHPETLVGLPPLRCKQDGPTLNGEIITIDHFGNLITSIGPLIWHDDGTLTLHCKSAPTQLISHQATTVTLGDVQLRGIHRTYGDTAPGDVLALVGSSGYLEISMNQGNAANALSATIGDSVTLTQSEAAP